MSEIGTGRIRKPAQLKRFENKAQLLRHISESEGVDIDELWEEYDRQVDRSTEGPH